jgi:anti-anti-sigma regulatory factor
MSQPSPHPIPPELLERDSLPALVAHLRARGSAEMRLDFSGVHRLSTPAVQVLLAACRDGVRLRLSGAGPGLAQALGLLGVAGFLPLEGEGA